MTYSLNFSFNSDVFIYRSFRDLSLNYFFMFVSFQHVQIFRFSFASVLFYRFLYNVNFLLALFYLYTYCFCNVFFLGAGSFNVFCVRVSSYSCCFLCFGCQLSSLVLCIKYRISLIWYMYSCVSSNCRDEYATAYFTFFFHLPFCLFARTDPTANPDASVWTMNSRSKFGKRKIGFF